MGRTAHRAIDELLAADALYLGDVEPDAVYLGSTLIYSATPVVAGDALLLESGDALLLESGDKLLLEVV